MPNEVKVGYRQSDDITAVDLETRCRLKFKNNKLISHDKGSDAYKREFHVNPTLTIWIDRIDWFDYFDAPVGTPSIGRSQDLAKLDAVEIKEITSIESGNLSCCMLPFNSSSAIPVQLVQLAEPYH